MLRGNRGDPGETRSRLTSLAVVLALLLAPGCGYVGAAVALALSASSDGGGTKEAPQAAPVAYVLEVVRQEGNVTIPYGLSDANDDAVDVEVRVSTDNGSTFPLLASDAGPASGSEGRTGLAAPPGGMTHGFVWDSALDLGPGAFTEVWIEITPTDATGLEGEKARSQRIIVGNDAPLLSLDPAQITTASGLVALTYTLEDTTTDPCEILVAFSTDTGWNWQDATIAAGATKDLTSGEPGQAVTHNFAWNSLADGGVVNLPEVRLRITPRDDFDEDGSPDGTGTPVETNDFSVQNNDSPVAFIQPVDRQDGNVDIQFILADPQGDPIDVSFEYENLTDGNPFTGMQLTPASPTTGLASDVQGVLHTVTWESASEQDILGDAKRVRVKVTPTDPNDPWGSGQERISNEFTVGNVPPQISVDNKSGEDVHKEQVITLKFTLVDTTSDPVDLTLEYRVWDPVGMLWGSWTDTTADVAVGIVRDTPTAPDPGLDQKVAWNSAAAVVNDTRKVQVRITPQDKATGTIEVGNTGSTGTFTVDNFERPVAYLASPLDGNVTGGDVTISCLLFESSSAPLDIRVEYSIDGSPPSRIPTERPGPPSEGLGPLSSAPGGAPHTFVWDSAADLPGIDSTTVQVAVTPIDSGGQDGIASPLVPAVFYLNNNREPTAAVLTPQGSQTGGEVVIDYVLFDDEGDIADIDVLYSLNGTSFLSASPSANPANDGLTGLTTAPEVVGGVPHVFVWDTSAATGDDIGFLAPETTVVVRIVPRDNPFLPLGKGTRGQSDFFTVDNTTPPSAVLLPVADPGSDDVVVEYDLLDAESAAQAVLVEFSTDGFFNDMREATECPAACTPATPSSEGTTGLASSPAGTRHVFRWASVADLGRSYVPGVQVRITPSDTKSGSPAVSNVFAVDNNDAPVAFVQTPGGIPAGDIVISYSLSDTNSDPADLTLVQYTTDPTSGNWIDATERVGLPSEGTTGLITSPGGVNHIFVWDSTSNLGFGVESTVAFRLQPSDTAVGNFAETGPFPVNNRQLLPVVRIDPVARSLADDVIITTIIADGDSDPVDVTIQWRQNLGPWSDASDAGGASEGKLGLASSPGGTAHTFVWDSANLLDLGTSGVAEDLLEIRIVPTDTDGQGFGDTSNVFIRGNDVPQVAITSPAGGSGSGLIEFAYDLVDSTGDLVDLEVTYDLGQGAGPQFATISVGETVDLSSSPSPGTPHTLAWNSVADLGIGNHPGVVVRLLPGDFVGGNGIFDEVTIDVDNNDLPISFIGSPAAGDLRSGPVVVDHILIDGNSDPIDITVEFWNGTGYGMAAEVVGPPSEGSAGLVSSPDGMGHTFVWDSEDPLAFPAADFDGVKLRITPSDPNNSGVPFETPPFLINNNREPMASVSTPKGSQGGGEVIIDYVLFDDEGDPVDLNVYYSLDGTGFLAAASSANPVNEGVGGLTASPTGEPHVFVWDTSAATGDDVGILAPETTVVFRIIPWDHPVRALGRGPRGQTDFFAVDNTVPPQVNNLANVGNSGIVTINYDLFDTEPPGGPTVDLEVVYVVAGTEGPATILLPDEGSILGNLLQGQTPGNIGPGAPHSFQWDSLADLGPTDITGIPGGVQIKVVPMDTKIGAAATIDFDVLNNDLPEVIIFDVVGVQSRDVNVVYRLRDSFSDPLTIDVEYLESPLGAWTSATGSTDPASEGTGPLTSGPLGQEAGHIFIWDSFADLATQIMSEVQIRIRATDPSGTGSWFPSNVFTVDNSISADLVLGQDDLTRSEIDGRGLEYARGLGWDGTNLYIADTSDNRILMLHAIPASDFQTADIVLGQPDMTTNLEPIDGFSARSLWNPGGIYSDGSALYVADQTSNRILIWNASPTVDHAPADHVLGQVSFSSAVPGAGRNGMNNPRSVSGDSSYLYVADRDNHRVLIWAIPGGGWTDGQDADYVLGQADFNANLANRGGAAAGDTLNSPRAVFSDGVTLFCADTLNHRVLQWDIPPLWADGLTANRVLGQPDMSGSTPDDDDGSLPTCTDGGAGSQSRRTLREPSDVCADAGATYVSEPKNNRVLVWNSPAPGTYACADFVLGQPDGLTDGPNDGGRDATSLESPNAVLSTGSKLLILDTGNSRVKIHNDVAALADDAPADVVFGQEGVSDGLEYHRGITARSVSRPGGIATDGVVLFIPDGQFNRVLGWSTLPDVNNKNADLVFGWDSFTVGEVADPVAATTLSDPRDVAYDPLANGGAGRLFVADRGNHRIVIHDGPFTTGQAGSQFLGQPDAITRSAGSGAEGMRGPIGVAWDGARLWVADRGNNRVLGFDGGNLATGALADYLLGQAAFGPGNDSANHSGVGDPEGDNSLYSPSAIESTGNDLLVADQRNHRVLIWSLPLPTGLDDPATLVIGQPDFASRLPGLDRSGLAYPGGVHWAGASLHVTDSWSNRILVWDSMPAGNGLPADRLLGQQDFGSFRPNYEGVTARSLFTRGRGTYLTSVTGSAASETVGGITHLWFPDRINGRVLRYDVTP